MGTIPHIRPSLLGKMNERQVLHVLQAHGPLSRAEVARRTGLSAPTVSKAVASLLQAGLLEESATPEQTRGRPAVTLRLASESVQVLGVVLDAGRCEVVAAGFDGNLRPESCATFPTPDSYDELLDGLEDLIREQMARPGVTTLGVGISMPGLIDSRRRCGVLSPNLPVTDGQCPADDLEARLGVETVLVQESQGLCLAERAYGNARSLDDFAMLDASVGVGLGVMAGGRLLTGHCGLAGELGHIPVVEDGRPCGCGNRGCLETVASDSAFAWRVSRKLGRRLDIDRALALVQRRVPDGDGAAAMVEELEETCRWLAVGVAAVINLFNPSTLFVHARIFEADPNLFERLIELAGKRALPPSFAGCRVVRARGRKAQGAVAAIIQHLTSAIAPTLEIKAL